MGTLGSTWGSCDTSSWAWHFSSDTRTCGLRSGGRQPAAGQCAQGKFSTNWQCGNCIGDYISCQRSIALGTAVWAIALTHTNARSLDQSTVLGVSSSALVALFPMVIGLASGRHAGVVAARNRCFPARLRYIFMQEARPAFPS